MAAAVAMLSIGGTGGYSWVGEVGTGRSVGADCTMEPVVLTALMLLAVLVVLVAGCEFLVPSVC